MKKTFALLMVLILCVSSFVGCSTDNTETVTNEDKVLNISMVTDSGGVNDESFNQNAWEGLTRSKKDFGVDVSYFESNQEADYEVNLESLVDNETDLIWGIGFMMAEALLGTAQNYPESKFAIVDYSYGENTPENVIGVTFRENESSFLVGYIAGKMTETNKVAFVGGMDGYVINKFQYGYMAGVNAANPEVEVVVQYAGTFTDAAAGKSIAEQMYNNGVDIIYQAAGITGNGVIEAAKEQNEWVIGADRDQAFLAPENVLTSSLKRVDNAMYNVIKELTEGKWEGGVTLNYGLAEGGVGIADSTSEIVPQSVLDEVDQISAKIIAGTIVVPDNKVDYEKMK